ncbi:ankyrin repeat domain-containing protein 13B [Dunckerocampus dactyliophorus]|uniref:ankyrin repeat domain-containing protein 13B n=1 Tax=Dunckerocampus dactyliophorus TaxID=161453 RepID=UPI0024070457|nr:ankyrin repeat domain-containing protein 13B [Dunckerocampus dactyliophorus]XP_054649766.1 ankyrin repeat domain-containing protein 13B [Dunckerocampus dactyliophorus]
MISAKKTPEKSRYPVHYLVWHNKHRQLEKELAANEQTDVESLDPRGRTPLHLAVTLGHLDCARVLLEHGADVSKENRNGWTVLQEAVSTRDPELVRLVLRYRDYQRTAKRLAGIPVLLERLRQAQDFYVEMKWEFTSWVPLVSRICPSDTYRVWKSGQCLRVDTTLTGFEQMTWQRGNRSFIFRGQDSNAEVMEVDHDRQLVFCETLCVSSLTALSPGWGKSGACSSTAAGLGLLGGVQPSDEQVAGRLSAPVVTTQLDTRNVAFERNKTGILGWRSEKTETVNGYEAKVYAASNVELITRTRTDHLSDQNKNKIKGGKTPLQNFLGIAEQHVGLNNGALVTQMSSPAVTNPSALTAEEYFNPGPSPTLRDIGHPCQLTTKTQRFKAKLWLCESHPLSLAEQVAPIIDLMAISNALFAKLRDFITLRLPPGFPVKIEIPLYHILNARITFSNLNGCEEGASVRPDNEAGVEGDGQRYTLRTDTPSPGSDSSSVSSSSSTMSCRVGEIPPCVFEPPPGYTMLGGKQRDSMREEEEDLLQFAIQQSLLEAGSEYDQVTIWEALTNSKPGTHALSCDPSRLERIPQLKPRSPSSLSSTPSKKQATPCSYDEQLRIAMEMSAREQEEAELRRQKEEEELQHIIRLSLMEK